MVEEQHVFIEEQHPIPQQISAFQFRLVGDMTLKQFVQLAGGAVVALLFYASGLPPIVKWPLIFFSFGGGAALAFLPLEDRPLGKWIVSFFKSIYSPTVFKWQKLTVEPKYFAPETEAAPAGIPPATVVNTLPTAKLVQQPSEVKLEEKEQTFLQNISTMSQVPATTTVSGVAPITTQVPITPPGEKTKPYLVVPTARVTSLSKDEGKRGFELPSEKIPTPSPFSTNTVSPIYGSASKITEKEASYSDEAAPPAPPTTPNTVVGQVTDKEGKIIEGVILEIKDAQGRSARALKTNKLGHFMIVTPLVSGRYEMVIEKEGFEFEPITFEAKGNIISPILIKAK